MPTFLVYILLYYHILPYVGIHFRGSALWPEGPLRSSDTFLQLEVPLGKTYMISPAPSIE